MQGGSASEWELIGDILLEKGSDLEMALKERRKKLLAGAQYQVTKALLYTLRTVIGINFPITLIQLNNE